jgi:hypothetical protein
VRASEEEGWMIYMRIHLKNRKNHAFIHAWQLKQLVWSSTLTSD